MAPGVYKISVVLFVNCVGSGPPSAVTVDFHPVSGTCSPFFVGLNSVAYEELPFLAPGLSSTCISPGSVYSGYKKSVFEVTVNIDTNCAYFLSMEMCCRSASTQNIQNPNSTTLYVGGILLDPRNGICNSSPHFNDNTALIICDNQATVRNMGGYDPDEDSLAYELVPAMKGPWPGANVSYYPGYSFLNPMGPDWNVFLDPQTGDLFFNPSPGGPGYNEFRIMVYEYRNGILIGSSCRDFAVYAEGACANNQAMPVPVMVGPFPGGTSLRGNDTLVIACGSGLFCIDFQSIDSDISDSLILAWDAHLTFATFSHPSNAAITDTISGVSQVTGRLCLTSIPEPGTYTFNLWFTDKKGPYLTQNARTFVLDFQNFSPRVIQVFASPSTNFCPGVPIILSADTGFVNYMWSNGANGNSIPASSPGNYRVIARDSQNCYAISQPVPVAAFTVLPFEISPQGPIELCTGDSILLSANSGLTNYSWSTGSSSTSVTVDTTEILSVSATDANGCIVSAGPLSVTLVSSYQPAINPTSPYTICEGESGILSVTGFYPHYLWNTGDTTRSVSVSTAGNYTVTVSSSMGCVGISDSLNLIIDTLDAQMVFTNRSVYTDFVCTTPGVVTVFWDFGDGSTSDAQSISYVYANPGVYPIILIVSDSFCSDTIYQNINILISLDDSVKIRRDQVWSADEKIFFSNQVAGDYRVQLFDLNGKRLNTVFSGYLTPQKHIFPVPAGLPAGLFIIRVESESEVISSKFLSGY